VRIARIALPALLTLSCGGGQTRLNGIFSTDWQDDGGAGARAVQAKITAIPIPKGTPVAVGVVDSGLVGMPLGSEKSWSFAHAIDARPSIAGSVVVGTGGGEIFALDAGTGQRLWVKKAAGALRGAGDDGKTTVISLASAGEGSIILAVTHDGTVLRQLEASPAVGIPAVVGNYAFFPWQGQYVTIYNVATGSEEARLLFREQVSRAFTHGGKLYFGELGLFRYDDQTWRASTQKASHVTLPVHGLPGDPKWFLPGNEVRGPASDARDDVTLLAAPASSADLALDSGRFVATYYKVAVGFDAKSGNVTWATKHGSDFVAGSPFEGGVALCDEDGKITILSTASGDMISEKSLGQKVKSCAVEADGFPAAQPPPAAGKSFTQRITEAIDLNENDMVAIQRVLLRELGKTEDPSATKALIDIASDPRTPPPLVADAENALAARRNGADFMIEALGRHYDFLKDVLKPPPVGPMADALLAMKESRAAPALVSHLFDPADTTDAIKRAAAALAQVATKSELAQLKSFFALYRTTADDESLAQAVVSVAQAIVKLGGPEDKALVTRGAEDPMTISAIKPQLSALTK
jgi:outer membrane protein assembly factor BamB